MSSSDPVNRPHLPHALPQSPTRILGREQDVERLVHRLSMPETRLLTLTGPGGVGKTRLALEVAHRLDRHFAGAVYWVDLAPLREADLALAAIAAAMGVPDINPQPLLATLIEALRDRRLLLVLDNIEQIADLAHPVAELVAACPELRILGTGRSPLHVRAEQRYPVEPLPVPTPNRLADQQRLAALAAVSLFAERAQAVQPDFALTDENTKMVAEICRRLDGLPLAVELAATQIEIFAPHELISRLDRQMPLAVDGARDLPARHQSLERTFAWGYDLLSDDERALFRRLSVFAGGFTLAAVNSVLHDSPTEENERVIPRQVSTLLRRSLLHRSPDATGQERFRMLETTRMYALERLEACGEADVIQRRHAHLFLDLAEQAFNQLTGPNGATWLSRLDMDRDNLRAALTWALATGEASLAANLATALARFWYVRGHLSEGRTWLERVLSALGPAPTVERASLLRALGVIAGAQGDTATATKLTEEALAISRELGDERAVAQALQTRGTAAHAEGKLAAARRYNTKALTILERLDDLNGMAVVLNNLGLIAADEGDARRAKNLLERSRRICERLGSQRGLAIANCNLGYQIFQIDGPRAAVPYFRTALNLFGTLEEAGGVAWCLQAVATLAHEGDGAPHAARLHGAAAGIRGRIGWSFSAQGRADYEASLVTVRRQLGEHEFARAWTAGQNLSLEEALDEVSSLLTCIEDRSAGISGQPADLAAGLSEREVEILRLIAAGLTNAEIAHRLQRSPHTIDAHVRRIYRKLDVQSRSAATRFAAEHGLL